MRSVTAAAAAPDLKGITVLLNTDSCPPISHWISGIWVVLRAVGVGSHPCHGRRWQCAMGAEGKAEQAESLVLVGTALLIFPAFRKEQLLLRFASTQHSKTVSERLRNRMIVCKRGWYWGKKKIEGKKKASFYLVWVTVCRDLLTSFFLSSWGAEIHPIFFYPFFSLPFNECWDSSIIN